MLDRSTLTQWTRDVMAFVNKNVTGAQLAKQPKGWPPLPFQRRSAAHYEALRQQAESALRWIAGHRITDAVRHGRGMEWLTDHDVVTDTHYSFVTLDAALRYDDEGRIALSWPRVRSVDAKVALTIAELLSPDCPVEIRVCKLETCGRLFVRERGEGSGAGRRAECCSPAHAATFRTHKHRKRNRKRSRTKVRD